MDECVESEGAMKPTTMVQTSPIILTPTNVESPIPINSSLISSPSALQRFRKILPKSDNNGSMTMENSLGENNNLSASIMPNSYIVIIPTINNTKLQTLKNDSPPNLPSTDKKIPILSLTVDRKYDNDQSLKKTKNDNDDNSINKTNEFNSIVHDERRQDKNDKVEEVVINHKTLNKLVVFSLDKMTDKISVSFRDNSSVIGRNAKLPGIHMKLRENPPKRKTWDEPEHLKTMYKRVKRDCYTLRSRLHVLRNKHEKEKAAVGKLQKKLVELEKSTSAISTTPSTARRSIGILLKSASKLAPKNINNKKKLSILEKTDTFNLEPAAINRKLFLKLNNNEDIYHLNNIHPKRTINSNGNKFLSKANRPKGHYNSIQIDGARVTVEDPKVESLDLYGNIMGTPYLIQ
ncbi:hypothetical protein PV326_008457 [Microctonus aethiopoides]|uniref:Uncharacterized protein n=1 Tax=Microctonus aethiopoides TaxID=144406 RepID=A0AA39FYK5_9HYME|nr:hypothetical protein PV326_008457 [Microctonus aethiopoides]KAK0178237.1 hypothetical protein PV328_002209 [Microctonus aethiopoides]